MKKISQKEKSLDQRKTECSTVLDRYPDRVCVYIEKQQRCKNIKDLEKHKYLVPKTITAAQFIIVIRSKLEIPKDKAIFFYVHNTIMSGTALMSDFNTKYKSDDGFLYVTYIGENCYG